ncbi:MAG: ATP-binding protein [Alphaproteobacteria bacterium]|nr:ATP-binding protein [Alphaproteobacteria bacterium]
MLRTTSLSQAMPRNQAAPRQDNQPASRPPNSSSELLVTDEVVNLKGVFLAAKGVNYMRVNEVRRQIGLSWEHQQTQAWSESASILVVPSTYMPSKQLFTPRTRVVVEWVDENDLLEVILYCAGRGLLSPKSLLHSLILSVSTLSATQFRLAEFFFQNLARRANLPTKFFQSIEFCLAELIANAVLHGHLSETSQTKSAVSPQSHINPNADPLLQLDSIGLNPSKENLLRDPVIAKQHILISAIWGLNTPHSLEIAVTDKGSGLTPCALNPVVQNMFDPDTPSGRGLALIQKLGVDIKIEQSLREVRLIFA